MCRNSINTTRLWRCRPEAWSRRRRGDTGTRERAASAEGRPGLRPTAQGQPDVGRAAEVALEPVHSPQRLTEQRAPLPALLRPAVPPLPETDPARPGAPRVPRADSKGSREPSAALVTGGVWGPHTDCT